MSWEPEQRPGSDTMFPMPQERAPITGKERGGGGVGPGGHGGQTSWVWGSRVGGGVGGGPAGAVWEFMGKIHVITLAE